LRISAGAPPAADQYRSQFKLRASSKSAR